MAHNSLLLITRLGFAYTLLYSLRNLIVTASAYLFEVGDLDRKTFAIMQTISFFFIFLCKFASGPILRLIKHFNHLVGFFMLLQLLTSIAFTLLATAGITHAHGSILATLFVAVYCIVKLASSFTRVTVLEIVYRAPDDNSKPFGAVSTLLQVLACTGDAGGKYTLGMLLNSHILHQFSSARHIPKWCVPMMVIANTVIFGVIVTSTVLRRRANNTDLCRRSSPAKNPRPTSSSTRSILRELICNPRFLICCGNSLVTSAISVAMGTYGSHFMRYKIGIPSEKVPLYDGVSPFCILFGVALGGFLLNRFSHVRARVLYFMSIPFLIAIVTLTCLIYIERIGFYGMLVLYYAHQTTFYAYQNALDGAYLMCIVDSSLAPSATGVVSGVGYLGGLVVPFIIMTYSTSSSGWTNILQVVFSLELLMLLPMAVLLILDMRRSSS